MLHCNIQQSLHDPRVKIEQGVENTLATSGVLLLVKLEYAKSVVIN